MPKYPDVEVEVDLTGPDGNVFALIAIVGRCITLAGHDSMPYFEEVEKIMNAGGKYKDVLSYIKKTVNATFVQ